MEKTCSSLKLVLTESTLSGSSTKTQRAKIKIQSSIQFSNRFTEIFSFTSTNKNSHRRKVSRIRKKSFVSRWSAEPRKLWRQIWYFCQPLGSSLSDEFEKRRSRKNSFVPPFSNRKLDEKLFSKRENSQSNVKSLRSIVRTEFERLTSSIGQ